MFGLHGRVVCDPILEAETLNKRLVFSLCRCGLVTRGRLWDRKRLLLLLLLLWVNTVVCLRRLRGEVLEVK
jgi:hypothetical protein